MVKEIFLISDGLPFFHYSRDQTMEDDDKVLLSSGFLGALKSFSETERSDALESFSMGTEYFLFRRYRDTNKVIICVFDREVSERLAHKSLQEIHDVIANANLADETIGVELGTPEKNLLKEKISHLITRLFGVEGESERVNELLEKRTDIPVAFLVTMDEKKVIAHFARPRPLFQERQVKEFFLLLSTLQTAFSRLKFPKSYAYFTISSADYVIASVWGGRYISIATGAPTIPKHDVLTAALNMAHYTSLETLVSPIESKGITSSAILRRDGELVHQEGEHLSTAITVFLSTVCTRINSFFRLITHRKFEEFEVTTNEGGIRRLTIHRSSSDDFVVEIKSAALD
ncbi:MAG: hypothetical protein ACE5OZ_03915 [Candidatus Heimdallarchaeota archaeon]